MADKITVKILGERNELNGLYLGLSEKTKETIKINTTQELDFQKEYTLEGTYNKNKVFIAVDPTLKEATIEDYVLSAEDIEKHHSDEDENETENNQNNIKQPIKKDLIIPQESKLDLSFENIKKYIQPKASDQEIQMFLQLCINQGLNPFIKDAYLIKYGTSPATMVVSKDAFLKKAEILNDYLGFEAGVVFITESERKIQHRQGSLLLEDEILIGGWARVFRKDKKDFYAEISTTEYATGKSSWNKMPNTMIRKVALVQALREAFPTSFQGMYDKAEIDIKEELK